MSAKLKRGQVLSWPNLFVTWPSEWMAKCHEWPSEYSAKWKRCKILQLKLWALFRPFLAHSWGLIWSLSNYKNKEDIILNYWKSQKWLIFQQTWNFFSWGNSYRKNRRWPRRWKEFYKITFNRKSVQFWQFFHFRQNKAFVYSKQKVQNKQQWAIAL